MALQVWLPLINNVENQGVSNIPIINNGVMFVDGGKIGNKCASFNNNYFSLQNLSNFNTISVSFWMKPSNTSQVGCLLNYRASVGLDISIFLVDGKIRFDAGGITIFNYTYTTDWQHITVTYDGNIKSLYVNGILNQSVTINKAISCSATKGTVGASSANTTSGSSNNYIGLLNDYRIYDHCLSPKEVKEISRGMVLHYKMCQPERSENLLSGSNITQTGAGTATGLSCDFRRIPVGSKFTLSIDIHCKNAVFSRVGFEPSPGGNYLECWLYSSDAGASNFNGRLHKVYTMTSSMSVNDMGQSGIYIQDLTSGTITIGHPKIEIGENSDPQWSPAPQDNPNWGTIEYDGSGFKNHSSHPSNSVPVLVSDSPRYTGSYKFIGNTSQLNIPITKMSGYTICFWRKGTATEKWLPLSDSGSNKWLGAAELSGSYETIYHRDCSCGTCYVDGVASTTYPRDNNWHFYCYTNVTLDWNGVWIHGYNGYRPTDYWSDFRIYATALDATDVAELYKLGR